MKPKLAREWGQKVASSWQRDAQSLPSVAGLLHLELPLMLVCVTMSRGCSSCCRMDPSVGRSVQFVVSLLCRCLWCEQRRGVSGLFVLGILGIVFFSFSHCSCCAIPCMVPGCGTVRSRGPDLALLLKVICTIHRSWLCI